MKIHLAGLFVLFSGLYFTQVTKISPVYLVFLGSFLYILVYIVYKHKILRNNFLTSSILVVIALLYQFYLSDFSRALNLVMTFMSPLVVILLFRFESYKFSFFKRYSIFYGIVFILDGLYRLINPDMTHVDKLNELGIGYHIYKFNSLLYSDSNFVGLQAVFVLSVFLWSVRSFRSKVYVSDVLVVCLITLSIFLSFSRAAYVGCLFAFVLFFIRGGMVTYFCGLISSGIVLILLADNLASDITFSQKIQIFERTIELMNDGSLMSVMFGVGAGNADALVGKGTHNLFLTLLYEGGVMSLIFFVFYLLFYWRKLGEDLFLLVAPFLIVSMSAGTLAIPYFFSVLTLIYLNDLELTRNKKRYTCV